MGIFDIGNDEYSSTYAEEAAIVDASELIANALEQNGMTRKELSSALGTDEVDVTGCLAGDRDMTIRQLAKIVHFLGGRLELKSSI